MSPNRIPPLTALRAFEAVGRYGVADAARELNVTPAAISHQIRVLEAELGVALFVRAKQGLVLTLKGQQYLTDVAASFDALAESSRRLTDPSSSGRLVIDSLPSFATDFLVPRLHRFREAHSDIDLEIKTPPRIFGRTINFEQSGANIAIRGGGVAGEWPGMHAEMLCHEIQFPVCAPALARGPNAIKVPADLARHTLLNSTLAPEGWRDWLAAAAARGDDVSAVRLDRAIRFDLFNMSMTAAISGLGVDLGRAPLVDHWIAQGQLVAPFDLKVTSKLAYWLVTTDAFAARPEFRAFRDWLFAELEAPAVSRRKTSNKRTSKSGDRRARSRKTRKSSPSVRR